MSGRSISFANLLRYSIASFTDLFLASSCTNAPSVTRRASLSSHNGRKCQLRLADGGRKGCAYYCCFQRQWRAVQGHEQRDWLAACPDGHAVARRIRSVYVLVRNRGLGLRLIGISQVHLEQRLHRRARVESTLLWTFPGVCEPVFHQIPREMDVRSAELCLRLPQVRLPVSPLPKSDATPPYKVRAY